MIEIIHLNKSFGRHNVLTDVNLKLNAGDSISLIGPNGSGKTTLIKCILGMVFASSGEIRMNGENIRRSWLYRDKIGYMPQISRYPQNMKVRKLFRMLCDIRGVQENKTDRELVDTLGLAPFMDHALGTLSGGTRQKVSATTAFLFHPEVLILDEPTAGLDPLSTEIFKEKVNREGKNGKLVLVTSHILSDLEEITREVIYIHEGRIRFFKKISSVKEETGEDRLHKAIAKILKEDATLRYE